MMDDTLPLLSGDSAEMSNINGKRSVVSQPAQRGLIATALGGFVMGAVIASAALIGVLSTTNGPKAELALPKIIQEELNYITGLGSAKGESDPLIIYTSTCKVNCGGDELGSPTTFSSSDGELEVNLDVGVTRFRSVISFNTRAYGSNGHFGVPGPTLRVKPGDTLRIHLNNQLEFPTSSVGNFEGIDAEIMSAAGTCDPYGQANMTSLHLHGLLVSVSAKADNVCRLPGA
jgi:FtsP/CotA-like multicopper oxidase with cupredoxin domain